MAQRRFGKPNGLLCLLPVLLLMLTGVSAQAQPATGKPKADRLVMGLINPYRDYMRPWITGTPDHNIQHDPAFEWLFEVDPRRVGTTPGSPRARKWPRMAGPGASGCRRACSSTTAMANSRPGTWCTTTPVV